MLHHESREIDGQTWTVQAFPATIGLEILSKLLQLVGPSLGKAIASFDGDITKIDARVIGDALGELASRLADGSLAPLVKRLVSQTRVKSEGGKEEPVGGDSFDLFFMQGYGTLLKVCVFVLEVNYRLPLFDWLTRAGSAANAAARAAGEESSTSGK